MAKVKIGSDGAYLECPPPGTIVYTLVEYPCWRAKKQEVINTQACIVIVRAEGKPPQYGYVWTNDMSFENRKGLFVNLIERPKDVAAYLYSTQEAALRAGIAEEREQCEYTLKDLLLAESQIGVSNAAVDKPTRKA